MAYEVVMPQLGLTMDEGTIVHWYKTKGDEVKKGDPLFEVETDKATVVVEAPVTGVLGQVLIGPGATLPVGETIAWIVQAGEELPAESGVTGGDPTQTKVDKAQEPPSKAPAAQDILPTEAGIRASPSAKRLAREHRIDLSKVRGTGPGGRISEQDVLQLVEAEEEEDADEIVKPNRIRKLTAERMTLSFQTAPHFYLGVEVDAQGILDQRQKLLPAIEAEHGVRLTITDLLLGAISQALKEHSDVNASWADGNIRRHRRIHLGLATAMADGLAVPVIKDADRRSLGEIARLRSTLVDKARDGKLSPSDLEEGTFTVSNLGQHGVDFLYPIINPQQGAIFGIGQIRDRVLPVDGKVAIRATCFLTLSVDHRVVDGAAAAEFLSAVGQLIENPDVLFQKMPK